MPKETDSDSSLLNVCVLSGRVAKDPQWRTLPDGSVVTVFDIRTRTNGGRSEIVRASWMNAPTSAQELLEGSQVLVVGRVRTYWANRSVTDILCSAVVPLRSTAKVRRQVVAAMASLQEACP